MTLRTSIASYLILLWFCVHWLACAGTPSDLSAQCLVDEDCGSCGVCEDGACRFEDELDSFRCVTEAEDPCDGIDNDDNGIVDDPETCWAPVFRYQGGAASICLASSPLSAPPQCEGATLVSAKPAFWLASRPIAATVPIRRCSKGGVHVLARDGGPAEDGLSETAPAQAWRALGYDCEGLLGYAFTDAEREGQFLDGQVCPLTRRLEGDHHAYLLGAQAGGRCDPGFGEVAVLAEACTGSPPPDCHLAACPPLPGARFVASRYSDGLVLQPFEYVIQTWTLENIGPVDWPASWHFVSIEGPNGTGAIVPLPRLVPVGDRITFEIEIGAPSSGLDLLQHWAIVTEDQRIFGHVTLRYSVATPYGGRVVFRRPEPSSEHRPGSDLTLSVVLENTIAATWPTGSRLVRQSGQLSTVTEVELDRDIPFGARWSVDLPARAPTTFGDWGETWRFETPAGTPIAIDGSYVRFGIRVLGDHRAQVLTETYPDGTVVRPGTRFAKLYLIENTGVWGWGRGWSFRASSASDLSELDAIHLVDPVSPGERTWLAIPMWVPQSPTNRSWQDAWYLYDADGNVVPVGRSTEAGLTWTNDQNKWMQTRIVSGEPCRIP